MIRLLFVTLSLLLGACHSLASYDPGKPRGEEGAEIEVVAPYAALADWNDYVAVSDVGAGPYGQPAVACDTDVANRATDCVHGGQLREVTVAAELDCASLDYRDERGAFKWSCSSGAGRTVFRTTALTRGLAGLLDASGFATNSFIIERAGTPLYRSVAAVWGWTNPVLPLPGQTDVSIVDLDVAGAVYFVDASTKTRGLHFGADGVALVVADGATLSVVDGIGDNCVTTSGVISPTPAAANAQRTVLCAGARARLWLEGAIAADQTNVRTAVMLVGTRMSRLHRLRVLDAFDVGLVMRGGAANRLEKVQVQRIGRGYALATHEAGLFVDKETGLRARSIFVADALGAGITLQDCRDCALTELVSSNNGEAALEIVRGHEISATAALLTASRYGVLAAQTTRVTLAHLTAAHNSDDGVRLEDATQVTVLSLASLSNGNDGIDLRRSDGTKLVDLLLAYHALDSQGGMYCFECANNELHGGFWVGNNRIDCSGQRAGANIGFVLDSCTGSGVEGSVDWGGASTATLRLGVECAGCVAGRVTSDSSCRADVAGAAPHDSLLGSFFCAESPYRTWGREGSDLAATVVRGRCDGGNCRLWDFRAKAPPMRDVRGSAVDGEPCPPRTVERIADLQGNTLVLGALERVGDGLGDDDGLCERGESCVLAPHLGADQALDSAGRCTSGLPALWPQTIWFKTD